MSGKLGTKQATPRQIVQIATELDAAFDTTTHRYRPGYNDIVIAQKVGTSPHAVHNVRKSLGLEIKREPPKPKPKPGQVPEAVMARLAAVETMVAANTASPDIPALKRNLGILEERIQRLETKEDATPSDVAAIMQRLETLSSAVVDGAVNNSISISRMKYILERIGNNTPGIRYGMLMLEAENKIKRAPKPNGEA